jgi:hypothetical protein
VEYLLTGIPAQLFDDPPGSGPENDPTVQGGPALPASVGGSEGEGCGTQITSFFNCYIIPYFLE